MATKLVRKEASLDLKATEALALGSVGLAILAALLPWHEVGFFRIYSQTGLDEGFGIGTIILALVAAWVIFDTKGHLDKRLSVGISAMGAMVAGLAGCAVLGYHGIWVIGIGAWLTILAGVGLFFAGLGFLDRNYR
jgi:hypothetical protein